MDTVEEFRSYYDDVLKPNLIDVFRKKIISVMIMCVIITAVLVGLTAYLYIRILSYLSFNYCMVFIFTEMFFVVSVSVKSMAEHKKEHRDILIYSIIWLLSGSSQKAGIWYEKQVNSDAVRECTLFDVSKAKVSGANYTLLMEKSNSIVLSDISVSDYKIKGRKRIKRSLFSGIYLSATFNKPVKEKIYIIPNNINDTFLKKVKEQIKFDGVRVVLENLQFEKKYNVYSHDETQARYILSLKLMERINELDEIFPSLKKYFVFRQDGKISIFFEGLSIEYIKTSPLYLLLKNKTYKSAENIFNEFNKFKRLYKILDLDNKLYINN